jgi:hypothetical protein
MTAQALVLSLGLLKDEIMMTKTISEAIAILLLSLPIIIGIVWYIMAVQSGLNPWIPLPFGLVALGIYLICLHGNGSD